MPLLFIILAYFRFASGFEKLSSVFFYLYFNFRFASGFKNLAMYFNLSYLFLVCIWFPKSCSAFVFIIFAYFRCLSIQVHGFVWKVLWGSTSTERGLLQFLKKPKHIRRRLCICSRHLSVFFDCRLRLLPYPYFLIDVLLLTNSFESFRYIYTEH